MKFQGFAGLAESVPEVIKKSEAFQDVWEPWVILTTQGARPFAIIGEFVKGAVGAFSFPSKLLTLSAFVVAHSRL